MQQIQEAEVMPKLRKSAPKEEPKSEPEKPKTKAKAKPKPKSKYEDLPEIPDYKRPELEKYEKSDFVPTDFSKKTDVPLKMEKPTFEIEKPKIEVAEVKNGHPEKQQIIIEEPKDRKLVMGKGNLKDDDNDKDSAKLRPVIKEPEEEPVEVKVSVYFYFDGFGIYNKTILVIPARYFLHIDKTVAGKQAHTNYISLIKKTVLLYNAINAIDNYMYFKLTIYKTSTLLFIYQRSILLNPFTLRRIRIIYSNF